MIDKYQNAVFLDSIPWLPFSRSMLFVQRAPIYLRFVIDPNGKLDALDQLDDVPKSNEYIVAAKFYRNGSVHLDGTVKGHRVGQWIHVRYYAALENQPEQSILQSRSSWEHFVSQEVQK